MVIKARFVAPVVQPVLENGAIEIQEGRIAAVGRSDQLAGSPCIDFEDSLILPGLVNAHTHLELGHLRGRVSPNSSLIEWLVQLVTMQRADRPGSQSARKSVQQGLAESLSSGVTALADTTRFPQVTRSILAEWPMRAISFGEVISIGRRRQTDPRAVAREILDGRAGDGSSNSPVHRANDTPPAPIGRGAVVNGIGPHAPYTMEPQALRACADVARERNARLSIHALESPHEREFTLQRSGPLAQFLRTLEVWDDDIPIGGCGPIELLDRCGLLGPRSLLAHVNYATDEDLSRIAASGAHVVFCPRTHRAFGHPPHRFRDMLAAGINVCLGTDSLASNPSLSILEEVRFLREMDPEFPADELISLATMHGATALGFGESIGSLEPGKAADLVVLPLPASGAAGRWTSVLEAPLRPVAVFIGGRKVVG